MRIANLNEREAFITKDGSTVRELAGPALSNAENQSLAEAEVPPDGQTDEHFHVKSEEIYYFVSGAGRMRLGEEEHDVRAGDCVAISPGVKHKLWNPEGESLVLLCASSPAYSHDDTVLTGG